MEIGFAAVSVLLLFLYLRERSRYRQMEREYRYINERLCQLRKREESSYILIPSGLSLVRETGEKLNDLLEEFYEREKDYTRKERSLLRILTNISHDLRTPITVLKGYIEMLYLQSRKEELSPAMEAIIIKMQNNSEELVRSVNHLFDVAKIQSGDWILQIQEVNLTQICRETVLEFSDLLERENFRVELHMKDQPLYGQTDAEALRRILKNLIDNGIKYGKEGGFLGLSLYEKGEDIFIEIEDHGQGIREKDREQIFARAYTMDRQQGNGLGLAIAQGLAKAMGGAVSVSSIPHTKTVFTVLLKRTDNEKQNVQS